MLYFFVEGPDDEQYFAKIFAPLTGQYQIVRYADMPNHKINSFLSTIDQIPDCDYLFLGDADGKSIEERKECLLEKYNKLSAEKLYIVQFEIESWYYAGATEEECRKLKLKHFVFDTNTLTKEQFCSKLSQKSDKKYIMECLLEAYSLSYAITRNSSLNIFATSIKERTCNAVF